MKVYPIVTKDGVKESGIDLRDYFAAMAMQGILSSPNYEAYSIARAAYMIADDMIEERTNGEG